MRRGKFRTLLIIPIILALLLTAIPIALPRDVAYAQGPPPTITSVDPTQGIQGQTLWVNIYGTNLIPPFTAIGFGAGIAVESWSNFNSTFIGGSIVIDAHATPGPRNVTVTTSDGSATLIDGFTVVTNNWPKFHYDLALSGYKTSIAPNTNTTLWIYNTGAPVFSSPAIVDGKLYIGGTDSNLYALDANTGAFLWKFPTGGPIYSSPAVAYGNVYFLSTDGNIYAVNANTGVQVWKTPVDAVPGGGPSPWSSPAVDDYMVFIAASNGWVHSLNALNGAIIWSTNVGGQPNGPITVVNGKVYSGTHNFVAGIPTLFALNEFTGAVIWTYTYTNWHPPIVGMINSNGAAVVDGNGDGNLEVYFGVVTWNADGTPAIGVGNEAICLNETNGNEIWAQNLHGWSTSTPAVHNGVVFIGSDDGNVYALNAGTGAYVWNFLTGAPVWAAPAVADGKVFVGSLDHIFYSLNETSGALIWSYNTSASRIEGSPAVACGKVFVGNENGNVYAFGPVPVVVSCDNLGNEVNQFLANQPVYVKGSCFTPFAWYNIWIQPDPVNNGQGLNGAQDPSGVQEAVQADAAGNIPVTLIWPAPLGGLMSNWDIVIDNGNGVFNPPFDGIDSAQVVGFVAPVPELPTIVMLGIGLVGLAGWLGLRRRRKSVLQA